jgi:hypothetical protein
LAAALAAPAAGAAADFYLKETPALTEIPVGKVNPKTKGLADRPGDDLVDAAVGFISYETWAKTRPVHRRLLSLYPDYAEPNTDLIVDGVRRRFRERLHMYVAEARLVLDRRADSFDLKRFATLPFLERLDPAIRHRLLTPADRRPRTAKVIYNQHPQRTWCEGRDTVVCIRSAYKLEGRLPVGIALANKLREGSRQISDTLEFDSELTVLPATEVEEVGLKQLTGLDTSATGALEQSIYYVNQVMQFGKLLAVVQAHPADPAKAVVSVFTALAIESNILGKQKQYAKVPVLRNMVPAQVLLGKSSFNSGKSLSAGLPVYARNQMRAIAAILEADGAAAGGQGRR